jgi:hypothetical protein
MFWVMLTFVVLVAISLWWTWTRTEDGASCGVSLLDWFDLF